MSVYYFKPNIPQNPNVNFASSTGHCTSYYYSGLHLKVKEFFHGSTNRMTKENTSFISDFFSNNLRVFVGQSG